MNKIKKYWQENKVLLVMGIILLICLTVIVFVSLTYFYGGDDRRLEESEKMPLSSNLFSEIENKLKENEIVKKVNILQKNKIIYVMIDFVEETKMDKAKEIARSVLEFFNEDELNVYDIQFSISSLSTNDFTGYTLMGARNSNGSGEIVWNNYNIKVEEE